MTTYYVRTDGNDGNAGTTDSSGGAWATIPYAATQVAAGDTVMVRGAAGNAASFPTSGLDFTSGTYCVPASGSVAAGWVKWIGYNGMPTIGSDGLMFYSMGYNWWENFYFVMTGNTNAQYGIMNSLDQPGVVLDCIFNLNGQTGGNSAGFGGGKFCNNIVRGIASSVSSLSQKGFVPQNYAGQIVGNRFFNICGHGLVVPAGQGSQIRNNLIYGCYGDGIQLNDNSASLAAAILGNTIDGNGGHGIYFNDGGGLMGCLVQNNNITNHIGSGKAGIKVNSGTQALNDYRKIFDYNNVWNNTANYDGVSAGANDVSVDPDYVDAANGDFTPQEEAIKAAFPINF